MTKERKQNHHESIGHPQSQLETFKFIDPYNFNINQADINNA